MNLEAKQRLHLTAATQIFTLHKFEVLGFPPSVRKPSGGGWNYPQPKTVFVTGKSDREAKILGKKKFAEKGIKVTNIVVQSSDQIDAKKYPKVYMTYYGISKEDLLTQLGKQ